MKNIKVLPIIGFAFCLGLQGCSTPLIQACKPEVQASAEIPNITDICHFRFDKSEISPQDMPALDKFAAFLIEHPEVKANIDGFADVRGPHDYNVALGLRRAESIAQYLQEKGIDAERIKISSFGADKLEDMGFSKEAHARNRRAVLYLEQESNIA